MTPDFFSNNRLKLASLVKDETTPIVISANVLIQKSRDEHYPFFQDNDFWYLTGLDEPAVLLVIYKNDEYLILSEKNNYEIIFRGNDDRDDFSKKSGIKQIFEHREGISKLQEIILSSKKVAILEPPIDFDNYYKIFSSPHKKMLKDLLDSIRHNITFIDISTKLAEMRSIKQPEEIELIKKAVSMTNDALDFALGTDKLKKYKNTAEVKTEILYHLLKNGSSGFSFEPIVSIGKKACTLHSNEKNQPINPSELILIDVGAYFGRYSSDLTRTVAIDKMTPRQQAVYDCVEDVSNYARSIIKPGIIIQKYEELVTQYMSEKLDGLSIKGFTKEKTKRYFTHWTSHFLGLDEHDSGDYNATYKENMVITVEPGIYIPEESIGIRLECDVLITKDGCEIL